jgi:hypothetical protein
MGNDGPICAKSFEARLDITLTDANNRWGMSATPDDEDAGGHHVRKINSLKQVPCPGRRFNPLYLINGKLQARDPCP